MKKINNSLAFKLVAMYIIASSTILVIFSMIVHSAIESHFSQQDYLHLKEKIQSLSSNNEIELDELNLLNIPAWVVENNQVLKSNEIANKLPKKMLSSSFFEWSIDGRFYKAYKFEVKKHQFIVLQIETTHHKIFLTKLNSILTWSLILSLVLSVLYALFIVRVTLIPLNSLTKYIEKVNISNLHLRIPEDLLPIEFQKLISSQNNMLERLQSRFLRLSEFSSDIAHELRTPLTNIMMQTQVAINKDRTADEYYNVLVSNIEEIERINKVISDTLYLAKSENNLLHKTKFKLRFKDILLPLVDYYEVLAEDKNVIITVNGDANILADKEMLQRAFGNVLSNALRHCYSETEITIDISEYQEQKMVKISNYGEPIPKDSLPFIFERFYRSDKSRVHSSSVGAGLGLPIAKAIMNEHNGDLTVNSNGNITEFLFSFKIL
ncbi:heavy metal sensor histidine kinase (plasmid) [Vibrio sp. SS-MA-C1-2]|uniref:heavy metal sensor histidine kinase n=1 Tax=Vibrio sp. SS-MA-C1-2 TaxID=2908646 RepID=UPI001F3EDBB0|nr:heavy metal sensor histidine kinase [Vibrio sp. SS-MA-C1-2]UJF20192.1 heavy metal sensor histidine kinase [Vibrio sp. SS-MA-C1-2]